MPRLRLYDCRVSELPETNGLCQSDIQGVAKLVNRCERRLLYAKEASEESWYGTFAEVLFSNVSRNAPYITCNRHIARIEFLTVCHHAVPVQNQFFEYLTFGNGRMPRLCAMDNWGVRNAFTRNNSVTFYNLPNPPQQIRIYSTDPADAAAGQRVLLQGLDQNNQTIYTQDGANEVRGEYVYFDTPFATSVNLFQAPLYGIQKDVTAGIVQFFAVDPVTGNETLILTMEPSEQVAGYRRYYLHNLPCNCTPPSVVGNACTPQTVQTVQVRAIAKLELIPVVVDQDYLLLHNLEALIEEGKAIHFSDMQDSTSKGQAAIHHLNAIRLLKGELVHYYGKDEPAVQFRPFGSARLERLNVSMI